MKQTSTSGDPACGRHGFSLAFRLSIWSALVLTVTTVAVYILAYFLLRATIENRERTLIDSRLEDYRRTLRAGGTPLLQSRFQSERNREAEIFFIRIVGANGQALFVNNPQGNTDVLPLIEKLEPSQTGDWIRIEDGHLDTTWFLASTEVQPGLTLQVGKSSQGDTRLLASFKQIFPRVVIPLVILGVLGIALLTYHAIRPVRSLISTVRDIIHTGDLNKRVDATRGRTELDELVALFNEMLRRNDKLLTTMRESLDNVAHDLRTPMTRLRTIAESAVATPDTNTESLRNALGDTVEESDRIIAMLNALMDVAEAETGAMRLNRSSIPVNQLLATAAEFHQFVAEDKDIQIIIEPPATIHALSETTPPPGNPPAPLPDQGPSIYGDPGRLQQVFSNLIDNAVKYSDPGTTVTLRTRPDPNNPNQLEIEVADHGTGIPATEINRIWSRLYRADRSRAKRGLGLGLSLVKAITEAHGGSVAVESSPGSGSRFLVRLPIAKPDTPA